MEAHLGKGGCATQGSDSFLTRLIGRGYKGMQGYTSVYKANKNYFFRGGRIDFTGKAKRGEPAAGPAFWRMKDYRRELLTLETVSQRKIARRGRKPLMYGKTCCKPLLIAGQPLSPRLNAIHT